MEASAQVVTDYGLWTLAPSLVAIGMALITRQVFVSLFLGVWIGAWVLADMQVTAIPDAFLRVVDTYLLRALAPESGDSDRMSLILFSLITGGMIGVITKNGGMEGIVRHLMRFANTRKKGQGVATGLGALIFFDDYANTLIVGNTMQPLMDKLKISREKIGVHCGFYCGACGCHSRGNDMVCF